MVKKTKKKIIFDVKSSIGPSEISLSRLIKWTLDVSKRNIKSGKNPPCNWWKYFAIVWITLAKFFSVDLACYLSLSGRECCKRICSLHPEMPLSKGPSNPLSFSHLVLLQPQFTFFTHHQNMTTKYLVTPPSTLRLVAKHYPFFSPSNSLLCALGLFVEKKSSKQNLSFSSWLGRDWYEVILGSQVHRAAAI